MFKFFKFLFLILLSFLFFIAYITYQELPYLTKLKLFLTIINKPLNQIQNEYATMPCPTKEEMDKGFSAFITGYCKPEANKFNDRQKFLCAVGLNCSCPNGRTKKNNCFNKNGFSWSSCQDFDDKKIDYCHLTASGATPAKGQVAADWKCFPKNSKITINGLGDFEVTDKGLIITGRRFDIWTENCENDLMGIYNVTLKK